MVQAITADQMPAELAAAWQRATAAAIEAALPAGPKAPETWALFAVLLPHAQTALADDSDGMRKAADYLGYSGSTRPPGIFTSGCWMPWCGRHSRSHFRGPRSSTPPNGTCTGTACPPTTGRHLALPGPPRGTIEDINKYRAEPSKHQVSTRGQA
jgi:hypothetical protein